MIIAKPFVFLTRVITLMVLPFLWAGLWAVFWPLILPMPTSTALVPVMGTAAAESITGKAAIPDPYAAAITEADCLDFINENPARVRCGFIDLPVNHNDPDHGDGHGDGQGDGQGDGNGKVTLPVLIAGQTRTLSATPSERAILVPGGGGPGGSIGFGLAYLEGEYLEYYDSLRSAGLDIVILDQRGAGLSRPALRCPGAATAFKKSVAAKHSFAEAMSLYREAMNSCRKKFAIEKLSITDFDTYQSARDYLAVIQLLPYDWWGTLATSYATVIAQAMESIKPGTFDRIVLDSPVALDYQRPFTFELAETAIQRVLSLCEITRRCNRKYGDIKNKFKQVVQRAKESPYLVNFNNPEHGASNTQLEMLIDDTTLLDMLTVAAYSNYTLLEIPWIINELHENRAQQLQTMVADYWHYNSDLDFATGLSWAIHCKERQLLEAEYLQRYPDEPQSYSADSKFAMQQERLICKDWATPVTHSLLPEQSFTAKTLLIAGDLDPVISRDDINNTADNFTDKQVKILPGMGHSVWFQSQCTRRNVVVFLSEETSDKLADCRDGITRFK